MQMNKAMLTIGAVILIFVLLFGVYKLVNGPSTSLYPEVNVVKTTDHIKWSPEKKNILVIYSDFQCPACKNFHNLLNGFEASGSSDLDITKKVTLVYRHFPLYQLHQFSLDASYTAEAAGKQGKFNEMSDLLFNSQEEWDKSSSPKEYFVKLAQNLNLNIDQFKKDIDSSSIKDRVQEDITSGEKASINSTPTFFLNGKKLENIQSIEDFKKQLRNL